MVSILPPKISPWQQIGKAMSQFSQNLPNVLEQRYQQERGMSAIDELQTSIKDANGDMSKILPALMKAYTKNPSLERSGLGQQYLQMAKAGITPSIDEIKGKSGQDQGQGLPNFLNGSGQSTGQREPEQQTQPNLEQPQNPNQQPKTENLQLGTYLPYNLGEQISPDQRAEILTQVKRNGGDVDFTRQQIDDYNSGKISQTDLANANVDKKSAQTQRQLGFENQIKQRIDKQLPPDTPESEKNLYYNMINKELPNHKDFTSAWQAISNKVDNFRKTYQTYVKSIPEDDLMGLSEDAQAKYRNSAQPLLKQDPLAYNVLEDAFTKKGNSIVTPAKILKPLPEDVRNIAKSAGDYRDLLYPKGSFFHEVTHDEMMKNIDKADTQQKDEIPKLSKQLEKKWNDNISLINIFADLKAKGWQLDNITQLLDTLSDNFSPQQQKERVQLNQAPRVPIKYLK